MGQFWTQFTPVWHQRLATSFATVVSCLPLLNLMLAVSSVALQNVVVVVVVATLLLLAPCLPPPPFQATGPPLRVVGGLH